MKTHEYLSHLLSQRALLLSIKDKADPASGVTFSVRRGVARDNDEVEDDATKRPWATVECSDMQISGEVIDLLLSANLAIIQNFQRWTLAEIAEAQSVLDASKTQATNAK